MEHYLFLRRTVRDSVLLAEVLVLAVATAKNVHMNAMAADANDRAIIHEVEGYLHKCDARQLAHISSPTRTCQLPLNEPWISADFTMIHQQPGGCQSAPPLAGDPACLFPSG